MQTDSRRAKYLPLGLVIALAFLLNGCAPHGWRQYVAHDGTDTGVEAAYLECRDTGPYANTVRLLYGVEYTNSQYDCMKAKGFRTRR